MAYDFLGHVEGKVTCSSDEFGNFRRMMTVQTTNIENEREHYMNKRILETLRPAEFKSKIVRHSVTKVTHFSPAALAFYKIEAEKKKKPDGLTTCKSGFELVE